jgi:hypothetical protein
MRCLLIRGDVMYRIKGKIEGMADILFNAPPPIEDTKGAGKAPSKMSADELRVEAMKKLHRDARGLFLPETALLESLFAGSNRAGLKDGRRALSGTLKATLFVEGGLLFGREEPDYIHEVWGRVPPRTGGMVVLRRPALTTGWTLPFTLLVADDRIGAGQVREALDTAGLLVGVGAWRPIHGRYKVVEFETVKA